MGDAFTVAVAVPKKDKLISIANVFIRENFCLFVYLFAHLCIYLVAFWWYLIRHFKKKIYTFIQLLIIYFLH